MSRIEGSSNHSRTPGFLIGLLLVFLTLLAYWQLPRNDFISLDDNVYVTDNREVQKGLSFKAIGWALTSTYGGHWHPMTWLSHMFDYELFGLNPAGHHLVNLLFHIGNVLLLWFVLERMESHGRALKDIGSSAGENALGLRWEKTRFPWRSGFVAALFALHPLHVESVAWVAERKDVLCAFFWMLTMWSYLRYVESKKRSRYLLVIFCFVLALMSKPMAVTLPFVLLLLDYWPLGRFSTKQTSKSSLRERLTHLTIEKAPLFVLAAISSVFTFFEHSKTGTVMSFSRFPLGLRIGNALVSYVTYIKKMFWPSDLAILYPHPSSLSSEEVAAAALFLVLITVLAIVALRRRPYLAVGWLWYLGTLVPVIGLVQAGVQARADRFTYIPLIGLFIMVVYGVTDVLAEWRYRKIGLATFGALVVALMLMITRSQVKRWKNDLTLFEHTLRVTEQNYVIHNNLGVALAKQGRDEEAWAHYRKALEINPRYADAHYNIGAHLAREGKDQEAMLHFVEALKINPRKAEVYNHIGVILASQGRNQEAILHFKEAIRCNASFGQAFRNLGTALLKIGRNQEALDSFSQALRIDPKDAKAHNNLGVTLGRLGKIKEAMAHYAEALMIDPDHAEAHYNLADMLSLQGKIPEAIAEYDKFLRIHPDDAEAHFKLGALLARQGRREEAIAHLVEAIRIHPAHAQSHYTLGTIYGERGQKALALKEYEILKKVDPELARKLYQRIAKPSK